MKVKIIMDIHFDQECETDLEKEAYLNSCKQFLNECGEGYCIDTNVYSIEEIKETE